MDNVGITKNSAIEVDDNTPLYSIGVVADVLGVSVQTLRLYEREGLIIPFKKGSKHRLYTNNDIARFRCIKDAINNFKFSIQAIKALYSLIPCWSILNCPESSRENCEAYKGHLKPCWSYKHLNNICALQSCNQCSVYTNHAHCGDIKSTLKEYTK